MQKSPIEEHRRILDWIKAKKCYAGDPFRNDGINSVTEDGDNLLMAYLRENKYNTLNCFNV